MSPSSDAVLLQLDHATRGAVKDFSLSLKAGETVKMIVGSREQRDDLLAMVSGLQRPTGGRVLLFGEDLAELPESAFLERCGQMGIVSEDGGLISNLKAWENLTLPASFHRGEPPESLEARVSGLARRLGIATGALAGMMGQLPDRLTALERRQVALMRAALMKPVWWVFDFIHAGLERSAGELMLKAAATLGEEAEAVLYLCQDDNVSAKIRADRTVRLGAEEE